jgi:hypothetical protein
MPLLTTGAGSGGDPTLAARINALILAATGSSPAASYLPGPPYWFTDAAKENPCANTETIYTWADSSGNGWDIIQATSTARPQAILSGAKWLSLFDGVDDVMVSSTGGDISGNISLWAVVRVLTRLTYSSIGGIGNTSSGRRRCLSVRNTTRLELNAALADTTSTGVVWDTSFRSVAATRTGQTVILYSGGAAVSATGPVGTLNPVVTTGITLGCSPSVTSEFTHMNVVAFGLAAAVLSPDTVASLNTLLAEVIP